MVWEWSHTDEAYEDLKTNISNLKREELVTIAAEILTYDFSVAQDKLRRIYMHEEEPTSGYDFNRNDWYDTKFYEEILQSDFFKEMSDEGLADIVCKFSRKMRECTNGGHQAYICPYHCHQLPFDLIKAEPDKAPILTQSHVVMLTNEHMGHDQYQLLTEPAVIEHVLKHNLNRYDLLDNAAIMYVVTADNSELDVFESEIVEAWYCGDRHPMLSTAVHLAYRKESET